MMGKYIRKYIVLFIVFLAVGAGVYLFFSMMSGRNDGQRHTFMNRAVQRINDSSDIMSEIEKIGSTDFGSEYEKRNIPVSIGYVTDGEAGKIADSATFWRLRDGRGYVYFVFDDDDTFMTIMICEGLTLLGFLITAFFLLYIDLKIVKPFNMLSEYPERIAKNENAEALPESKDRYFGKYVWGMNMLRDRLSGDSRTLRKLQKEQLTLVSTIAHGIKTPVANIKLYSEAIKSGLYREDGIPDPKDSEVAGKIAKNADDITGLLGELLDSASRGVVVFEPSIETFYLTEIEEFIKREYDNRLSVLRIPYEIDIRSRVMIESDKNGICRILTQLLENAIKYGDGKLLKILIDKNEDGYVFSVKNSGSRIPESEMPYVFNSFWRGSNADKVEGNGLGLYEASFIARKLGGDIAVRYIEEENATEFEVYIPLR